MSGPPVVGCACAVCATAPLPYLRRDESSTFMTSKGKNTVWQVQSTAYKEKKRSIGGRGRN